MICRIDFHPKAKKYFEKLKDKKLKKKFENVIYDDIATNPTMAGKKKKGNLSELYAASFTYQGISYRVGYEIKGNYVVIILLAGTREGFYDELMRIN